MERHSSRPSTIWRRNIASTTFASPAITQELTDLSSDLTLMFDKRCSNRSMEISRNGIRVPTPSFGQIESLFDVVWVVLPISQSLGHILFFLSTSRKPPTFFHHQMRLYRRPTLSRPELLPYKNVDLTLPLSILALWPPAFKLLFVSSEITLQPFVTSTSSAATSSLFEIQPLKKL